MEEGTIKYYASHFLWHAGQNRLFRMQRIGVDEVSGLCVWIEPLEAEMRHTIWLGGLIILAPPRSEIRAGESFQRFCTRVSVGVEAGMSLNAFQVVPFDVFSMEFTAKSCLVGL